MQGNIYHASLSLSHNFLSGYSAIYHHPSVNSSRITIFQLHLSQRGIIMTLPCGSIEQLKMEPLTIEQWPIRTQELRTKKVVHHFLAQYLFINKQFADQFVPVAPRSHFTPQNSISLMSSKGYTRFNPVLVAIYSDPGMPVRQHHSASLSVRPRSLHQRQNQVRIGIYDGSERRVGKSRFLQISIASAP